VHEGVSARQMVRVQLGSACGTEQCSRVTQLRCG